MNVELRILQFNNVQPFVNVLGSRFDCESSAITIVYTSVLESQVNHRNAGVESFSSLYHDQLRDLHPEIFERRWLGTDERVVHMRCHTCFVRLMPMKSSSSSNNWPSDVSSEENNVNRHL